MSDPASARIEALDALRGLIMLLMALDHAASFVAGQHSAEIWSMPAPSHPSALAFATRLVSHLCAPGFAFLMGMGMVLFAASRRAQGWREARITRHFLVRGVVLILLDTLLATPTALVASIGLDASGPLWPRAGGEILFGFGVLTALGAAMILSAALVRAPAVAAAVGVAVIVLTQLTISDAARVGEPYSVLMRVLLIPGRTDGFVTLYSILPWFGVTALGVAAGALLRKDPSRFFRLAPLAGALALALFAAVRAAGGFGNLTPPASDAWTSVLAVTKYPPSIAFLLLTLGVNALLLGAFAAARPALQHWLPPLLLLGRTPLFFYIAHLWLFAVIGRLIPGDTTLLGVYPVWLVGVAALLLPCRYVERFKQGRPADRQQ